MIIFGGLDDKGLLNTMYQFNTLVGSWAEIPISGDSYPSARSDACLILATPIIYLFGGKTVSGASSEL